VLRLQAFQFALRPNGEQLRNLRQFAGSCRFVYNKALALNVSRYEKKEKRLGYADLCALLANWKMEHQFSVCCTSASIAAIVKESRTCLHKLLSEKSRLPPVQEERPPGKLSHPTRLRDRQPKRAYQVAQTRLDALPQVARHPGKPATSLSVNHVASGTSHAKPD
jgi:hypothetical protein